MNIIIIKLAGRRNITEYYLQQRLLATPHKLGVREIFGYKFNVPQAALATQIKNTFKWARRCRKNISES